MIRKFYDLRPDEPFGADELDALQHAMQIDSERRSVERAFKRGNERGLRHALARLHAREQRPLR